MNTTYKRVGTAFAAVIAGSLLFVPALQTNAGSLPDPETVPCEAFGNDPGCVSRAERRKVAPRCAVPDLLSAGDAASTGAAEQPPSGTTSTSIADEDPSLVELLPHTNRL